MYERHMYEQYGMRAESWVQFGKHVGFEWNGEYFLFVPFHGTEEEWEEKLQWIDFFHQQGEWAIAQPVFSESGNMTTTFAEQSYLLFHLPEIRKKESSWNEELVGLANFHDKGKTLVSPVLDTYFSERWCHWWNLRLEQLEEWYRIIRKKRTYSSLDYFFIETFPYYAGRTENAIQWFKRRTAPAQWTNGVIAHRAFTSDCWLAVSEKSEFVKLPTDWRYDHPTRDIAEWLREKEHMEQALEQVYSYEQTYPLTERNREFIFGRLLFPYEYFHAVEETYQRETDILEANLLHLWQREPIILEQLAYLLRTYVSVGEDVPEWLLQSSIFLQK